MAKVERKNSDDSEVVEAEASISTKKRRTNDQGIYLGVMFDYYGLYSFVY